MKATKQEEDILMQTIFQKMNNKKIFKIQKGKKAKLLSMLLAGSFTLGTLSGCGSELFWKESPDMSLETATPKTTEATNMPSETTTQKTTEQTGDSSKQFHSGINQFSYHLFDELAEEKNVFFSPYSIAMAISMLDNGADGKTKEELETVLGIKDLNTWNASAKDYLSLYENGNPKLLTANSVWLSNYFALSKTAEQKFLSPLKEYYNAEQYKMDLSGTKALEAINSWISKKTNGMIDPFLNKPLDDINMALINAVYFEGKWETAFYEEYTEPNTFYGKEHTSTTDMMNQTDVSYPTLSRHGIEAVELPYENETLAMDILIPTQGKDDILSLFSGLSDEEKSAFFTDLSNAETKELNTLMIPKFEMEYGVENISNQLKALGMKQAFCKGGFDSISKDFQIDEVLHKAKIEVNEAGTKAAAATAVINELGMSTDDLPTSFLVTRPFIYVIRDVDTDMILFMGYMQDME